nr:hypothetical protein [uncultured Actinotalea sp.]
MSTGLAPGAGALFVPALYDLLWVVGALLLPLGALAVLYLVVRTAARRGSSGAAVDTGAGVRATAAGSSHAAAEASRRHGAVVAGVAWGLAAVLPQGVALLVGPLLVLLPGLLHGGPGSAPPYGALLVGLAPAVPGLTYLTVHAVGERTWPRPQGPVRRASLAPRPTARLAPRRLLVVTAGWSAALAVALLVCAVVAQDGQRLVTTVGASIRTAGPFPGAFYGLPLAAGVALVLLATAAVLRRIARRPPVLEDDPAYDDAARRLSAHRVLRGTQLVVGWSLAGVVVVAGVALHDVGLAGAAAGLLGLGSAVALAALAVAVTPGRSPVPAPVLAPASPVDRPPSTLAQESA